MDFFYENHNWLFVVTFDNGLGQSEDQLPIIQIAITDESFERPGFLPTTQMHCENMK